MTSWVGRWLEHWTRSLEVEEPYPALQGGQERKPSPIRASVSSWAPTGVWSQRSFRSFYVLKLCLLFCVPDPGLSVLYALHLAP